MNGYPGGIRQSSYTCFDKQFMHSLIAKLSLIKLCPQTYKQKIIWEIKDLRIYLKMEQLQSLTHLLASLILLMLMTDL